MENGVSLPVQFVIASPDEIDYSSPVIARQGNAEAISKLKGGPRDCFAALAM